MTDSPALKAVPASPEAAQALAVREAYLSLARAIRGPEVRPKGERRPNLHVV